MECTMRHGFLFYSLLYRVIEGDCPLLEVLEVVRPHLQLTFENILAHINTIYVLKTRQGAMGRHQRNLRLKVCNTFFYCFVIQTHFILSIKLKKRHPTCVQNHFKTNLLLLSFLLFFSFNIKCIAYLYIILFAFRVRCCT